MCFGNKKIPDQLLIKVCFYAGVMTLGNRRSSRCIFTAEHRQARQIVLVLIALQTLMLGKEGRERGRKGRRERSDIPGVDIYKCKCILLCL